MIKQFLSSAIFWWDLPIVSTYLQLFSYFMKNTNPINHHKCKTTTKDFVINPQRPTIIRLAQRSTTHWRPWIFHLPFHLSTSHIPERHLDHHQCTITTTNTPADQPNSSSHIKHTNWSTRALIYAKMRKTYLKSIHTDDKRAVNGA